MNRRTPIKLPFNTDLTTIQTAKIAVHTLRTILRDFDAFRGDPEEFILRVSDVRGDFDLD
jgi:hypothetical protein